MMVQCSDPVRKSLSPSHSIKEVLGTGHSNLSVSATDGCMLAVTSAAYAVMSLVCGRLGLT